MLCEKLDKKRNTTQDTVSIHFALNEWQGHEFVWNAKWGFRSKQNTKQNIINNQVAIEATVIIISIIEVIERAVVITMHA